MAVTTDCTRSYISIVSPRMTGWTSSVMLCRYEVCQTARFPPSVNRLCSLFSATMLQSRNRLSIGPVHNSRFVQYLEGFSSSLAKPVLTKAKRGSFPSPNPREPAPGAGWGRRQQAAGWTEHCEMRTAGNCWLTFDHRGHRGHREERLGHGFTRRDTGFQLRTGKRQPMSVLR